MAENSRHFCVTPIPADKPIPAKVGYASKAAFLNGSMWNPGDTIRIRFLGGTQALRRRVREAAEEWLNHANLTFAFVDNSPAHIRIAFIEGDGSWSYIGTDCKHIQPDRPTMNYGWLDDNSSDEDVRSVVLHEFGHAIGLIHEHQNPKGGIRWNRDAVIADLSGPPNNWDEATIENNMFKAYGLADVTAGDVDDTSIMMYPIPASWTEDGYFSAGFNDTLSAEDKSIARQVYPF